MPKFVLRDEVPIATLLAAVANYDPVRGHETDVQALVLAATSSGGTITVDEGTMAQVVRSLQYSNGHAHKDPLLSSPALLSGALVLTQGAVDGYEGPLFREVSS